MNKVIDTFPVFLTYWAEAAGKPIEEQLASWAAGYMAQWPDLLVMQIEDYAAQHLDWRRVAGEKVFPYLAGRLPAMQEAHSNLLEWCAPVYAKAQNVLAFENDVTFVFYVGIGCGAGWVTPFRDSPAILFGLENIAECGWSGSATIQGLIAHEIGHLVHYHWRAQRGKPTGSGPWWQLYEEGFAQDCESLILNTEVGHQANRSNGDDWFQWCQDHTGWLAAEFLRLADANLPVSPFFGSWFDICGQRETGYFLERQVIKELKQKLGLMEIALLEDVEAYARPILEQMAHGTIVV